MKPLRSRTPGPSRDSADSPLSRSMIPPSTWAPKLTNTPESSTAPPMPSGTCLTGPTPSWAGPLTDEP